MMRFVQKLAAVLAATVMAAGLAAAQEVVREASPGPGPIGVLAQTQTKSKTRTSAPRHSGTHVYLLRGFMDIFSTGMDDLGVKLNRRGIRATVHNHGEYNQLAEQIIDRHRRGIRENVVIVGHSLGGNDAFRMAERLGEASITVPLIIAYDPTASMSVPRNVSRVVNFYSSTNGWGAPIQRGPGFSGSLSNVDLSRRGEVGHTDIDKSPALHNQSIGFIQSIGGSRRSTEATASPKSDPDKESQAKPESGPGPAADSKDDAGDRTAAVSGAKPEAAADGTAASNSN